MRQRFFQPVHLPQDVVELAIRLRGILGLTGKLAEFCHGLPDTGYFGPITRGKIGAGE